MDGKDQVGRAFLFMEARHILHEPKTCHNFAMESSVIERTAGGCSGGMFNHKVKQHLFNSILMTKFQLLDDHYQRKDLTLFSRPLSVHGMKPLKMFERAPMAIRWGSVWKKFLHFVALECFDPYTPSIWTHVLCSSSVYPECSRTVRVLSSCQVWERIWDWLFGNICLILSFFSIFKSNGDIIKSAWWALRRITQEIA